MRASTNDATLKRALSIFATVAALLLTGCGLVGPEVEQASWEHPEEITYQQSSQVTIIVKTGWLSDATAVDVHLGNSSPLVIRRKSQETMPNGRVRVTLDVVPVTAGVNLHTVVYPGRSNRNRYAIAFNARMPNLTDAAYPSFPEVADAPDESIHGSHITYWSGKHRKFISGHAASSICRVISSAIADFAVTRGKIDETFFVGAGFGSVTEDPSIKGQLDAEVAALKIPASVREAIASQVNGTDSLLAMAGNGDELNALADVISEPPSEQDAEAARHFSEVIERKSVPDNVREIMEWINTPESALQLEETPATSDFAELLPDIRAMSDTDRKAAVAVIRRYADYEDSEQILDRKVNEIRETAGLVRTRDSEDTQSEEVTGGVKYWIKGRPGEATLGLRRMQQPGMLEDLMSRFEGEGRSLLSDSEMPNGGGILFVPFWNNSTAEPIEFDVPKTLFFPVADKKGNQLPNEDIKKIFHDSVNHDILDELEKAAARQDEIYQKVKNQDLPMFSEEANNSGDPKKWLRKSRHITYTIVDDFGRPTGETQPRDISNFELWAERLNFAERTRVSRNQYKLAAERLREHADNNKAKLISDYTLIDAFLRGWDLAFVDNSQSSPYHKWLDDNRTVVWGEIFKQAGARHIDLGPLVSEQTVFQVRDGGDVYHITPMFVGNITDTVAVRSRQANIVGYSSSWTSRKVNYLDEAQVSPALWTKAGNEFGSSPGSALEQLARARIDAALQTGEEQQIEELKKAIAIDPSFAANNLLERLWNIVPTEAEPEAKRFESALANEDALRALKAKLDQAGRSQLDRHVMLKALKIGVHALACLSKAIDSLEANEGELADFRTKSVGCLAITEAGDAIVLDEAGLKEVLDVQHASLTKDAENWKFDTLSRLVVRSQLENALDLVGKLLLSRFSETFDAHESKKALRAKARLVWYTGQYLEALNFTLLNAGKAAHNDASIKLVEAVATVRQDLLKALLYGNEGFDAHDKDSEFLSDGEKQSTLAEQYAGTPANVFEARYADAFWVPKDFHRIPISVTVDKEAAPSLRTLAKVPEAATSFFVQPDTLKIVKPSDIGDAVPASPQANAGLLQLHGEAGAQTVLWMGNNGAFQTMALTARDDAEAREATLIYTFAKAPDPEDAIRRLESAGASMVERSKLPKDAWQPVALSRGNGIDFLAGAELVHFNVETGKADEIVKAAFGDTTRLADEHGTAENAALRKEAVRLLADPIRPADYFASTEAFPGLLAYAKLHDGLQLLIQGGEGPERWIFDKAGLKRSGTGVQAVREFQDAELGSILPASQDKVAFLHMSAFVSGEDSSAVTLGGVNMKVPVAEIRALVAGSGATPKLDEIFAGSTASPNQPIIVYRDGLVKSGGSGKGGGVIPPDATSAIPPDPDRDWMKDFLGPGIEQVPPTELVLALRRKYGTTRRFLLDDEPQQAVLNATEPVKVRGPQDMGAYIADRSFRVTDHGVIQRIRGDLEDSGVKVDTSMNSMDRRGVVVLTGHKDMALEGYVYEHMRKGNFKDRLVILFSCYSKGDAELAHRIVSEGGARGVIYFADKINPDAIEPVIAEFGAKLAALPQNSADGVDALKLFDESVEAVQKNTLNEGDVRLVEKLRRRIMQVSLAASGKARS